MSVYLSDLLGAGLISHRDMYSNWPTRASKEPGRIMCRFGPFLFNLRVAIWSFEWRCGCMYGGAQRSCRGL